MLLYELIHRLVGGVIYIVRIRYVKEDVRWWRWPDTSLDERETNTR